MRVLNSSMSTTVTGILARFPKTRLALPAEYQRIYEQLYRDNREGRTTASSVAQWMEGWMHRRVAADVRSPGAGPSTLEIGAGTLNHLPYEPGTSPYDIVEPFTALFRGSPHLGRVRSVYDDVAAIPEGTAFCRIISIAAFEHVCNLPEVVARAGLLLCDGGHLRVAIPSEGHFLWTAGWKLTTGLEFRLRRHLDYGVLLRHEHVNTADEIGAVLRIFFRTVQRCLFGLSRELSLYQFLDCWAPNTATCNEYLSRRARPLRDGAFPGTPPTPAGGRATPDISR